MKKSIHQLTMEQAFKNWRAQTVRGTVEHDNGAQPYRREAEQRREADVEQEERDAAREWLRHLEAGRIG